MTPFFEGAGYHAPFESACPHEKGGCMRNPVATRRGRGLVAAMAVAMTTGLFLFGTAGSAPASTALSKVDARVLRAVQSGGTATYWALLRQKADLSGASSISGWSARGWYV